MWSFFAVFSLLAQVIELNIVQYGTGGEVPPCVARHLLFVTQNLGVEESFSHVGVKWSNFSNSFK